MNSENGLSYATIMELKPCYDPVKWIGRDWTGTLAELLKREDIPVRDRIWLATRRGVMTEKCQRLFAVGCARRALARIKNPDPRSLAACDVAERFANGEATADELQTARSDADAAAYAYAAAADAYAAAAYAAAAYAAAADAAAAAAAADAAADAYAYAAHAYAYAYAYAAEREQQIRDLLGPLEKQG